MLYNRLSTRRNRRMTRAIDTILKEERNHTTFIAIGAGTKYMLIHIDTLCKYIATDLKIECCCKHISDVDEAYAVNTFFK